MSDSNFFDEDNEYAKEYGKLYTDKINQLEEVIVTEKTGKDTFNIFSIEAGLGKSRETLRIISENLYNWRNKRSFLVVRRFADDIERSVERLKYHNKAIRTIVLGITSDNWTSEWRMKKEKLKDIPVLIISHQRYIDLCSDEETRQAFIENREVLIIDEKVNFPVYTFSKATYDEVRSMLPTSIQKDYDKACNKLLRELEKQALNKNKNKCIRCEPKINSRTLDSFKKQMEVHIRNEHDMKKKSTLKNFMAGLELWYTTKCVYNGGNISTLNPTHKLWGLENNIILDASASIDGVYKLLPDHYRLRGQGRIVNHTNSKFTIINFNTSKSHLYYNQEFYPEICEKIKANHKHDDKTLIICHKENSNTIVQQLYKLGVTKIGKDDEYEDEDFAINWYGNLIGKNDYSEFTQCWLVGTPNLPYGHYLINYMMYKRSDLGRKATDIIPGKGRFKNDEFRAVQTGYIASEIYQSIKRIQRVAKPQGEFFIVSNDEEIVSMVLSQIKGATDIRYSHMDFEQKRKEEKKRDNVDRLVDYLLALPQENYTKKEIKEALNITNLDRLLTDSRVKTLLDTETGTGDIRIHYRHIERL